MVQKGGGVGFKLRGVKRGGRIQGVEPYEGGNSYVEMGAPSSSGDHQKESVTKCTGRGRPSLGGKSHSGGSRSKAGEYRKRGEDEKSLTGKW